MSAGKAIEMVEKYATAEIIPGDYHNFTIVLPDERRIAAYIPTMADAIAIKFGLQMFALAISDAATAELKIMTLAERIIEASKTAIPHDGGLAGYDLEQANEAIEAPNE